MRTLLGFLDVRALFFLKIIGLEETKASIIEAAII